MYTPICLSYWSYASHGNHACAEALLFVEGWSLQGSNTGSVDYQLFIYAGQAFNIEKIPDEIRNISLVQFNELRDSGKLKQISPLPAYESQNAGS